jgi:hypothetical protein
MMRPKNHVVHLSRDGGEHAGASVPLRFNRATASRIFRP